jgi:hypothetical protein
LYQGLTVGQRPGGFGVMATRRCEPSGGEDGGEEQAEAEGEVMDADDSNRPRLCLEVLERAIGRNLDSWLFTDHSFVAGYRIAIDHTAAGPWYWRLLDTPTEPPPKRRKEK